MNKRVLRRKLQGQTIVLIAGALVALLALVALAVDGGNAFAQRRIAQNGTDGAAMAGTTQMNAIFQSNRRTTAAGCAPNAAPCVNNISPDQNASVRAAIQAVLESHNEGRPVAATDFQAWYIKADGTQAQYGQAGSFESVPFMSARTPAGVTGVMVTWSKQTSTFFARIIGVNSVGADAKSGAQLGSMSSVRPQSAQGNSGPRLWPLTIMQDTLNVNGTTSLYDFNTGYGPGNWGLLCFTAASCGQSEISDWLRNGYDGNNMNLSPTMGGNFQSYNSFPVGNNGQNPPGGTGVWVDARTGNGISSACTILNQASAEHWHVAIPITAPDGAGQATNGSGGTNLRYHIVAIAMFEVTANDCSGNHNSISGRFIGYGWNSSWTTWEENLDPAIETGQTVLRLR